jgi:putative hydrolases of HD superfamily
MEIRWLGVDDVDRYRELRLRALADAPEAFASTYAEERAFAPEVWTARLSNDAAANLFATDDETPLGMATALREADGTAHIVGMWVTPEARGRGVGRYLIEAIAGWARDQGLRELALWVAEPNTPARTLYERCGFRPTGERQPLPSDTSVIESRLVRPVGRGLLAGRTPFPDDLDARLGEQFAFLVEIDRLKTIVRRSPLAAAPRRENDAEHSWHLAMMVLVLAEYADEPIDVGHTLKLVLVHDLVEIYAGDTPLYDPVACADQAEREAAAAERLFPLLPADQAATMRALWDEFEERRTPEARFARAMDRLQPLLLNWMSRGGTWAFPGVTVDDVRARNAVIGDASTGLGKTALRLIDEGRRRGWVR